MGYPSTCQGPVHVICVLELPKLSEGEPTPRRAQCIRHEMELAGAQGPIALGITFLSSCFVYCVEAKNTMRLGTWVGVS